MKFCIIFSLGTREIRSESNAKHIMKDRMRVYKFDDWSANSMERSQKSSLQIVPPSAAKTVLDRIGENLIEIHFDLKFKSN